MRRPYALRLVELLDPPVRRIHHAYGALLFSFRSALSLLGDLAVPIPPRVIRDHTKSAPSRLRQARFAASLFSRRLYDLGE